LNQHTKRKPVCNFSEVLAHKQQDNTQYDTNWPPHFTIEAINRVGPDSQVAFTHIFLLDYTPKSTQPTIAHRVKSTHNIYKIKYSVKRSYEAGGEPSMILVGPVQARKIANWNQAGRITENT